jgi:hypothetical protein
VTIARQVIFVTCRLLFLKIVQKSRAGTYVRNLRFDSVLETEFIVRDLIFAVGVAAVCALPAQAQQQAEQSSPLVGKKPSEILSLIEARPDFARLDEMSSSDRGYYEIQYRTNDKARVEINIGAGGNPADQE